MNVKEGVLQLLQENPGPVSGEEIAEKLGICRNSVWKAVGKLRQAGYEIEASTNKGYRLVSESAVLSGENIRRHLGPQAQGVAIQIRDTVTSTNTVVKELAEQGGREGMVVIAEHQVQGKGRLGRSFYSPRTSGLYMSILLRPSFSPEESLSITTAAAVATAQAIDRVTGELAKIKWVNDVYLRGRKVCGILTEASLDFESGGLNYAVLGIGVNIQEPPGGFPGEVREIAGAIFQKKPPAGTRSRLAAEILNHFFDYYHQLPQRTFMTEYRLRSLLTGMDITFRQGGSTWDGRVLGVDEEARLVVRLEDGKEKRFSAGEVAIIKKDFIEKLRTKREGVTP